MPGPLLLWARGPVGGCPSWTTPPEILGLQGSTLLGPARVNEPEAGAP